MHDRQDGRIGLRTAQCSGNDRPEGMREKHTKSMSVELRRSVKHCNERRMIIEFNEKSYLRSYLSSCRSSSSSLPDPRHHHDPDRRLRMMMMMKFITPGGLWLRGQLTNITCSSLTNSMNAFEPLRYICPCGVSCALKYMIIDDCRSCCCSASQGLFLECLASLIQRPKPYHCVYGVLWFVKKMRCKERGGALYEPILLCCSL